MDYGFLSVLPPIIAIGLAIISKDVLLSVITAVFIGFLTLQSFNPGAAFLSLMDETAGTLGSENITIVLIVVFLGGLVGLLVKSGGNKAFATTMSSRIKTGKGAQLAAWLTGVFIFFDDYFNCLMIGPVMRPITDTKGVSREKLAYIIDSTSASMCTLTPVSSWVAYILGIVATTFAAVGISDAPLAVYIQSIPYNMYAIFALILIPLVVLFKMDYGPMAKAEKRARENKGEMVAADAETMIGGEFDEMKTSEKGRVLDLVIPIVTLLAAAFLFMFWTGGLFDGANLMETFQNADSVGALYYASMIAILVAIVLYRVRGSVKVRESVEAVVTGMKSMVMVVVFMTCAWLLGGVCEQLGTGEYLVSLISGAQVGFMIPMLIFIVTCITTFATGSGWGSIAIMTPIALPMAAAMGANMPATLAAVLSGVVFGDHCSPICDTTIISSAGAQCNHLAHCKTQIPYALTAAAAAAVGLLVAGFVSSAIVALLAGLAVFVALVFILNRYTSARDAKQHAAES